MNNQSKNNSLMSQGSRLQQLSGKKSSLAVAVFAILTFHAVVLGGLLIQGCKQEKPQTEPPEGEPAAVSAVTPGTNQVSGEGMMDFYGNYPGDGAVVQKTNSLASTNAVGLLGEATNNPVPGIQSLPGQTPVAATPDQPVLGGVPAGVPSAPVTTNVVAAPAAMKEHKVVSGESFSKIARAYPGVSVKALMEANPGVEARSLKVGQILKVPAPEVKTPAPVTASAASTTVEKPVPGSETKDASGSVVYVVAPGDSLTRIAKKYGVKIVDLKTENRLAGDRINVGQKLKIPIATPAPAATNAAPAVVSSGVPTGVTAPGAVPVAQTTPAGVTVTKLGN